VSERFFDAIRRIVRELLRPTLFHGTFEYRVVDLVPPGSGFAQLQPVRRKDLPNLDRCNMWSGVPGGEGDPQLGSSVLVTFIDGDESRPFVLGYEGISTPGYLPTRAAMDASSHVDVGASSSTVNVGVNTATARVHVGGQEPSDPIAAVGRFVRFGDQVQVGSGSPGVITSVGGLMSKAGT